MKNLWTDIIQKAINAGKVKPADLPQNFEDLTSDELCQICWNHRLINTNDGIDDEKLAEEIKKGLFEEAFKHVLNIKKS